MRAGHARLFTLKLRVVMEKGKEYITKEFLEVSLGKVEAEITAVHTELRDIKEEFRTFSKISQQVLSNKKELEHTQERIRRVEENISKVAWTLGGAILLAVANFIIKGGLK